MHARADAALIVVTRWLAPKSAPNSLSTIAREFELPILVVINKMDRENANFGTVLTQMREPVPPAIVLCGYPCRSIAGQFCGSSNS